MINVLAGDVVILSDEESLGESPSGLTMLVKEVTVVKEQAQSCVWQIITTDSERIIVVKSTWDGESQDIKVMWESSEMPKGDKMDWVKAGFNWLFLPPENTDEFKGKDLIYTEEIFQNNDQFTQKSPTWYGTGNVDDGEDVFFAIHEWASSTAEYGELIAFEGGATNENGGYITFVQGKNISENDIEILNNHEEEL